MASALRILAGIAAALAAVAAKRRKSRLDLISGVSPWIFGIPPHTRKIALAAAVGESIHVPD
jgi:hypothetical protein